MQTHSPLVITPGDPAGIGPEVLLQAAQQFTAPVTVIADRKMLEQRAQQLGMSQAVFDKLTIKHVPLTTDCIAGQPNIKHAKYILATLDHAVAGCMSGEYAALVTGPINKALINSAGIKFSGHTEYLAHRTASNRSVMMLVTRSLKVALLTTHIPLKDVAASITAENLTETVSIINQALQSYFAIPKPHIALCGLNPHAGEGGHIGTEEQQIMLPALKKLQQHGVMVSGPLPADSVFLPTNLAKYDAILATYHDQGLPVLKHQGFGKAVNITLGLPIIRASVDHGTAYNLAGSGKASHGSLTAAVELAAQLVESKNRGA